MDNIIIYIKGAAAVLGGVFGALLGRVDGVLYALLVFMAIDYISGVMVAVKNHSLNSEIGFIGLAKKVFILLLVVVANMLDVHVIGNGSIVRGLVTAFYLANEGLSILENAGNLGVPFPDKLADILTQIKGGGDES